MYRLLTIVQLVPFLSLLVSPLWAQSDNPVFVCGNTAETSQEILRRLEENKAALDEFPVTFRSVTYVPLKLHLVAKSDGSGRVSFGDVLGQLCLLNEDFAELNMQFYIKDGFDLVDNTTIYDNHYATTFAMNSRKDANAVNVWVVGNIRNPDFDDNAITPGYYTPSNDWIVMRADRFGANQPFFTHEVGHFFSLDHTFLGWDFDPYDPQKHGVPAPARSPGGSATELQDGSNCEVAGDRICDTAPDYNNGFGWNSCEYTAEVLDPNGNKINPDERLHMSYFWQRSGCGKSYFSTKQKQLMQTDYTSNRRRSIRTGFTPIATEITEFAALLQPTNGSTTTGFNNILLEWSQVTGANHYLIEVDRLPTFATPNRKEVIATETSVELTGLEPGKRYFWRVRAFNEATLCSFPSAFASFTTGTTTNTNDLLYITAFSLSPNPAGRDQDLHIEMETSRSFDAHLQLFSITGQLMQDKGLVRFASGRNNYQLPLNGLLPGVYLLSMQSDLGRLTERVVVH